MISWFTNSILLLNLSTKYSTQMQTNVSTKDVVSLVAATRATSDLIKSPMLLSIRRSSFTLTTQYPGWELHVNYYCLITHWRLITISIHFISFLPSQFMYVTISGHFSFDECFTWQYWTVCKVRISASHASYSVYEGDNPVLINASRWPPLKLKGKPEDV